MTTSHLGIYTDDDAANNYDSGDDDHTLKHLDAYCGDDGSGDDEDDPMLDIIDESSDQQKGSTLGILVCVCWFAVISLCFYIYTNLDIDYFTLLMNFNQSSFRDILIVDNFGALFDQLLLHFHLCRKKVSCEYPHHFNE